MIWIFMIFLTGMCAGFSLGWALSLLINRNIEK